MRELVVAFACASWVSRESLVKFSVLAE